MGGGQGSFGFDKFGVQILDGLGGGFKSDEALGSGRDLVVLDVPKTDSLPSFLVFAAPLSVAFLAPFGDVFVFCFVCGLASVLCSFFLALFKTCRFLSLGFLCFEIP